MSFLPSWPLEFNTLVVFGFLLVAGAMGGYIAHKSPWIPSITGFMLVGFAVGPSGLNLLTVEVLSNSRVIIDIALGLILYRLGLSLDLRTLFRSPYLLVASMLESAATFLAVFFVLTFMGISQLTAALIAAISVSSSPAVLIHVGHEVGARGPVTESAQSLVALNNLISFVAFSALLPAFHIAADAPWQTIIYQPLYRFAGSVLVAVVIGYVLHYLAYKTKQAGQYHFALVAGAIMFTLGTAHALNLSLLFAPLVLGIVVTSLERNELVSSLDFGEAFELFFIVLFVSAGANLHVKELVHFGPAALALVAARSLAKWLGVFIGAKSFSLPTHQATSTGLLLIPMAGLAIGLVQTTERLFPEEASTVAALVLAAVAIFETIGPPVASWAFRMARETNEDVAHA